MNIENLEESGNTMRFTLSGARNGQANFIRRMATSYVKCFAINRVTVYENSSAMFDEYIAHRIGLVPISTPEKFNDTDEILMTLDATGPKTVYSGEIESQDKYVKVANKKIPIIKLGNEQRIKMECTATVGIGAKHAKFQTGLVTYEDKGGENFAFEIESFGQMEPREILENALNAVKEELKEALKDAKKI
jgi:DNA-directed RNA polymerase subunit D